jgi:chorismate dehydratase
MGLSSKFTLGYIPYLNCVPFFHNLKAAGFNGRFVPGVPAELNLMLQRGELNVSPSSSFEYARNWRDYLLLPGHSISSIEKVKSVLLFSPVDIAELSGWQIAITGESATSINLLRVIFREFYGIDDIDDAVPSKPIETLIAQRQPALLIGDRALIAANALVDEGMQIFDLGEIWYRQTGLPFVFALWMVSRNTVDAFTSELTALGDQLLQSRHHLMNEPASVATALAQDISLNPEEIVEYWNTIDYRFEEKHQRGAQLFFSLCQKYHLLSESPELNFLDL